MSTGRKPIPAALLNAADHKKSKEEIEARQEREAQLQTTARLVCPSNLSKEAKKEWHRTVKLYNGMEAKILNDLDKQLLAMYCEATAIYRKAQETWVQYQRVVSTNAEAQRILDKCIGTMSRQSTIIRGLAEQLCLSPVGRARMGTNPADLAKEDPIGDLFDED